MTATLLDTQTGETRTVNGPRSWEWAENNWSCDCNRMNAFGIEAEVENVCSGCHRFIVIDADFNDQDDYHYTLRQLNEGYPIELLTKHGIP
jgi:hypothetical protein